MNGGDRARRWPWAALIAAALVLAADGLVLGPAGPWDRLSLSSQADPHSIGVLRDRQRLRELGEADGSERVVFGIGSSRAERALSRRKPPAGFRYVGLTHMLIGPFEIRCAARQVLAHQPDLVVLPLSEFDTHGSRVFEQMRSDASFRNVSCFADLLSAAGPALAFEWRHQLLGLGAASVLRLYQLRQVLRDLGLDRLRSFSEDRRVRRPARGADAYPPELTAALDDDEALRAMIVSLNRRFPGRASIVHRGQFRLVREISGGEHVRIQMALLRGAVERLRAAGVEVLIVETPLYEGSYALYDAELRAEFLAFASSLREEFGVEFLPLEEQPAYEKDDFGDLTHMNVAGSVKFARAVRERIADWLGAGPSSRR